MYQAFRRGNLSKISMVTALFLLLSLGLPAGLLAETAPAALTAQTASTNSAEPISSKNTPTEPISSINVPAQSGSSKNTAPEPVTAEPRVTQKTLAPTPATLIKSQNLADGIKHYELYKVLNDGGMTKINYVKVDPTAPRIEIRPVLAGGKAGNLETLSKISIPCGAIAAINGNFYYPGGQKSPVDTTIVDGKVLVQSPREATSLVITSGKRVYIDKFLPQTTIRIPPKIDLPGRRHQSSCDNGVVVFDKLYAKDVTYNGDDCLELIMLRDSKEI